MLLAALAAVLIAAAPANASGAGGQRAGRVSVVVSARAYFRAPLLVPAPPRVRFVHGTMPGDTEAAKGLGVAVTDAASDTIYYDQPLDRFSRAHEIGHLLDAEILTDADRRRFTRIMRVPGAPDWWRGTGDDDGLLTPAEWFADYYAAAATRMDVRHGGVVSYATFTPRRLARFERALASLGRRHGLGPYR